MNACGEIQLANRREWLKRFGISVGTVGACLTTATQRAEAIGFGSELVALNIMNPEARKAAGRYKKVLLGGVSTLLSQAAIGVKKIDEYIDVILGADFGEVKKGAIKQRETADAGHWMYASRLLPFAKELVPSSQSIHKEFQIGMEQFLTPAPIRKMEDSQPEFADFNERELIYALTVEPRESINRLVERPIFPRGRRMNVEKKNDAVVAMAQALMDNLKSDDLRKVVGDQYQLSYIRNMHGGGANSLGLGFTFKAQVEPWKDFYWVTGYSSGEAMKRTVLLDRLLTNVLG